MRRKQRSTSTILHDLRNRAGTNHSTGTTASDTTSISVRDAARPAILPIPISSKLLGGRPDKQDKQQPNRPAPTRHRRTDLVDTICSGHRRNSRLHRPHTRLRRSPPFRRGRIRDLHLRTGIFPFPSFPRRNTSRNLWNGILSSERKNRQA